MTYWDSLHLPPPPASRRDGEAILPGGDSGIHRPGEYFAFGIKTVWVVSPPLRHVTIFTADGSEALFTEGIATEGIATDPVTGLTADLTKIFRPIGRV